VTFDPFGDFATRGYLRNLANEKDLAIVRRLEHTSFVTGLEQAFRDLGAAKTLTYENVLAAHKTLFSAVYPWAGEDRLTNLPNRLSRRAPSCSRIQRTSAAPSTTRLNWDRIAPSWPRGRAK
jgi:fido (protein-threonine AMPylation protein)